MTEKERIFRETILNSNPWKIEHRSDGLSFMAYPWLRDGKIDYAWVIGPVCPHVAEWLFDAVKRKQTLSQEKE